MRGWRVTRAHPPRPSLTPLPGSIRTELPQRNRANLTSFTLDYGWPDKPSARCLLDFFESAPASAKSDSNSRLHIFAVKVSDWRHWRISRVSTTQRQFPSLVRRNRRYPSTKKLGWEVDRIISGAEGGRVRWRNGATSLRTASARNRQQGDQLMVRYVTYSRAPSHGCSCLHRPALSAQDRVTTYTYLEPGPFSHPVCHLVLS